MTILNRKAVNLCLAATAFAFMNSSSFAYLGGFERVDGYSNITDPSGFNATRNDVANYNAGQFGTTVGTHYFTPSVFNNSLSPSPLWERLQGSALPVSAPSRTAYATAHSDYDRTWINSGRTVGSVTEQGLVITVNGDGWGTPPGSGPPREYKYNLDQFDLNGVLPSRTGNSVVNLSFWWCVDLPDPEVNGQLPEGYFGNQVSFFDSQGKKGFTLGTTQRRDFANLNNHDFDKVTYWDGASIQESSIIADNSRFDRWDLSLDLVNDTVSADYFDFSTGITHTLLTNVPMMNKLDDFTHMTFSTSPGPNLNESSLIALPFSRATKLVAFDDFEFEVIEACLEEAPLSDLLDGGIICSGDKEFSDFNYHGGGDMPAAEDIFVTAITDADGNFGIRYQGAFVDGVGGGASDALIDFKVTAPEGKLIKDVHLAANPVVIGGGEGLVSITETFLPDNEEVVLSVYDIAPGSRKLTDWADLVDENGELAPVQELHVQKDILVWSQEEGSIGTLSFIDQTFSQCDDLDGDGACDIGDPIPATLVSADLDLDGDVDDEDMHMWENAFGASSLGDANGDGDSDGNDFLAWQRQTGGSVLALSAASTVPEPGSVILFISAMLIAMSGLRKN